MGALLTTCQWFSLILKYPHLRTYLWGVAYRKTWSHVSSALGNKMEINPPNKSRSTLTAGLRPTVYGFSTASKYARLLWTLDNWRHGSLIPQIGGRRANLILQTFAQCGPAAESDGFSVGTAVDKCLTRWPRLEVRAAPDRPEQRRSLRSFVVQQIPFEPC